MKIITRKEAVAQRLPKYFTGKECLRGHTAQRYTKTGVCCACGVESARAHNSRINQRVALKKGELLVYKLADAEDFDSAWSYCQALDLARGVTPQPNPRVTALPSVVAGPVIADMRAAAFARASVYQDQPRTIGNAWERDGGKS